ncbi:MAG: hypothetical protein ABII82_12150 [Verrucomicrobiota bacterium]
MSISFSSTRGFRIRGGVESFVVDLVQEVAAERGLAAAHLADQHHEALALLHAEKQVLQRLLMRRAQVKELGIRRDVEGQLTQPIEALIHA